MSLRKKHNEAEILFNEAFSQISRKTPHLSAPKELKESALQALREGNPIQQQIPKTPQDDACKTWLEKHGQHELIDKNIQVKIKRYFENPSPRGSVATPENPDEMQEVKINSVSLTKREIYTDEVLYKKIQGAVGGEKLCIKYKDAKYKDLAVEGLSRHEELRKALLEQQRNPVMTAQMTKLQNAFHEFYILEQSELTPSHSKANNKQIISLLESYDYLVQLQEVFQKVVIPSVHLSSIYSADETKEDHEALKKQSKLTKNEALHIALKLQAEVNRLNAKLPLDSQDAQRITAINQTMQEILNLPTTKNSRQLAWNKLDRLEIEIQSITKGKRFFNMDVHGVSEISKIKKEVLGDVPQKQALKVLENESVLRESKRHNRKGTP